jgi:hypothetical protein
VLYRAYLSTELAENCVGCPAGFRYDHRKPFFRSSSTTFEHQSTRASGGCSGRLAAVGDSTRMVPAVWSLSAAMYFPTATSVTPNHPPCRYFHLLHLHIGACTLRLLALHDDKPEGIRTDSTRTHIDPCTTHVPRTNTEQLLG